MMNDLRLSLYPIESAGKSGEQKRTIFRRLGQVESLETEKWLASGRDKQSTRASYMTRRLGAWTHRSVTAT